MDDDTIREAYVYMYAERASEDAGGKNREIRQSNVRLLLMTCYRIAMDHYSEGPQTCILVSMNLKKSFDFFLIKFNYVLNFPLMP